MVRSAARTASSRAVPSNSTRFWPSQRRSSKLRSDLLDLAALKAQILDAAPSVAAEGVAVGGE